MGSGLPIETHPVPVETPGQSGILGKPARVGQADEIESRAAGTADTPAKSPLCRGNRAVRCRPPYRPRPDQECIRGRDRIGQPVKERSFIDHVHFFLDQTAVKSSDACSRMPLSERISSVALRAS